MNLKMNPFVSRLLRGAAIAVLLAVASGCGAPVEAEVDALAQTAEEASAPVHAQSLPTICSEDDYDRLACYASCGDSLSLCLGECDQYMGADRYACMRQCDFAYYSCYDNCCL